MGEYQDKGTLIKARIKKHMVMNRRNFIRKTAGAAIATAAVPKLMAWYRYSDKENRSILNKVISKEIPMRWEDAMLSGNGSTGIMVKGLPLDECIIVNHEKFWTIGNDYRPEFKLIELKGV